MPTRDAAPAGAPCWIDLFTSDPERSIAFYGDLFGWTYEVGGEEHGGYISFARDGVAVAGAMHNDGSQGVPDAWTIYLAVDDVDKTLATVEANGGQIHMPAMEIPGDVGVMGMFADPGNAAVGVWKPGLHEGFGVIAEPGAPGWFELHTAAYDSSLEFYRQVFGWDTHTASDSDELRYTTLGAGEAALAGVVDVTTWQPEGAPAQWYVYISSADVDATVTKAVAMGATVTQPAEDTPYGRLASLTDPTGAAVKLMG